MAISPAEKQKHPRTFFTLITELSLFRLQMDLKCCRLHFYRDRSASIWWTGLFPLYSSTVSFSLQSNSPMLCWAQDVAEQMLLCFSFCPPIFSASPFMLSCNKNTSHSQKCWGLLGWIQIYFCLKSPCFFMMLSLAETLAIPLKE